MGRTCTGLVASVAFAALLCMPFATPAQTAPTLGLTESFAVLSGQSVSNTGPSVITGNLGLHPGAMSSITGFPPGTVVGSTYAADAGGQVALDAKNDLIGAYDNLSQICTTDLTGQDLGGLTLTPGVYCFNSSAGLTGTLTLDAQGSPSAVFIFRTGVAGASTLTTASGSRVVMINGGSACNVFWQVSTSATLGTTTSFLGNILAMTSITLNTGANVTGRVLARNGSVVLDSNTISLAACPLVGPPPPPPPPTPVPTLPQWGALILAAGLLGLGYRRLRRHLA